jgi:hypothetical protein
MIVCTYMNSLLISLILQGGLISTSVLIDYEDLPITPPFLFKVLVSDGQDTSTATLTLSIVDKNENLSLSSSTYRMDVLEWTVSYIN